MVRARLEGDVRGRAARPVAGRGQGFDLGVGAAGRLGGTLPHDLAVEHDHAPDPGVGRRAEPGAPGEGQGLSHQLEVGAHLVPVRSRPRGEGAQESRRRGAGDVGRPVLSS